MIVLKLFFSVDKKKVSGAETAEMAVTASVQKYYALFLRLPQRFASEVSLLFVFFLVQIYDF